MRSSGKRYPPGIRTWLYHSCDIRLQIAWKDRRAPFTIALVECVVGNGRHDPYRGAVQRGMQMVCGVREEGQFVTAFNAPLAVITTITETYPCTLAAATVSVLKITHHHTFNGANVTRPVG